MEMGRGGGMEGMGVVGWLGLVLVWVGVLGVVVMAGVGVEVEVEVSGTGMEVEASVELLGMRVGMGVSALGTGVKLAVSVLSVTGIMLDVKGTRVARPRLLLAPIPLGL